MSAPLSRYPVAALLLAVLVVTTGCSHVHDAVTGPQPEAPGLRSAAMLGVSELRGRRVLTEDGSRELGRVADALASPDGRTVRLVVDVNPLMRRGSSRVVLDAERARFRPSSAFLTVVGITPEEFAQLPER